HGRTGDERAGKTIAPVAPSSRKTVAPVPRRRDGVRGAVAQNIRLAPAIERWAVVVELPGVDQILIETADRDDIASRTGRRGNDWRRQLVDVSHANDVARVSHVVGHQ